MLTGIQGLGDIFCLVINVVFIPVGLSQSGVGIRIVGIERNGPRKIFDGTLHRCGIAIILQITESTRVEIIGAGDRGPVLFELRPFVRGDFQLQHPERTLNNSVFQGKRVGGGSSNGISSQLAMRDCIYQGVGDAQGIGGMVQTAFNYKIYAQIFAGSIHIRDAPSVNLRGRGNLERMGRSELRELSGNSFREAIAESPHFGRRSDGAEWQNRNQFLVGSSNLSILRRSKSFLKLLQQAPPGSEYDNQNQNSHYGAPNHPFLVPAKNEVAWRQQ